MKKKGWIFIVGLALFSVLIPFFTAGLPGDSIFNIEVTHQQMKFRLIHENAIYGVAAAAVAIGLLTGISLFRFVLDKKESMIFLSMGITRKTLYFNRLLAGLFLLAGSIVLPMTLSLWLNIRALGIYTGLVRNYVYLSAGILDISCVSFLITAISCLVSGTLSEALAGWCVLIGGNTALSYGANLLMKKLVWGNALGMTLYTGDSQVSSSLLEKCSSWNPLLFFVGDIETYSRFYRPLSSDTPPALSWKLLIGWIIFTILLAGGGWLAFRFRQAEEAGIAGIGKILPEIVIAVTGFTVFVPVFYYLYGYHKILAWGLGILGFWLVHLFWRRTLYLGGTGMKWCFGSALGQSLLVAGFCLVLLSRFFGFDQYFLNHKEVIQAQVTYVGAPSFYYEEAKGSTTGKGYYLSASVKIEDEDTIEKIKKIQEDFIHTGIREMGSGTDDTVIPYDIVFSYENQEGKNYTWYYDRVSYSQLEALLSLEEEESVKENQTALFSTDGQSSSWAKKAYLQNQVYLSDGLFSQVYALNLSSEEREELLESLAKDFREMTLEQLYFPKSSSKAVLMFSDNETYDCKYFSYHLDNEFLYLTEDYVHTLQWLKEKEFLQLTEDSPEIEYVILQEMDPYQGMNDLSFPMGMYFMSYCGDTDEEFFIEKDFGNRETITDREEIEKISKDLRNGYYMTRGGYLAAVKLSGYDRYRYMFLPQE